jgi:Na+/melibiose symporter-like transporter
MPWKRSLLYGLANLAYFLGYSTFNSYALFFYTDHLRAPADLIGRAWLLFGIWNTVNDLLCGWLSDRIPARLGRRTFPLLALSLPVGVSFALIWNPLRPVVGLGPGALFWYFLLVASLYDVLQTAVNISQGAAFPEIARASGVRSRVAAVRQAAGTIGTALGVALSPLIYGRFGWGVLGMVWGAIISGLWLLSVPGFKGANAPTEAGAVHPSTRVQGSGEGSGQWSVVSGQFPTLDAQRSTLNASGSPNPRSGWKEGLRLIFGNRAFQVFLLVQLTVRLALAFVQLAMPYYATHVLGLASGQLSAVLGTLLGSAVLTVPVWPWLLRRLDPRAGGMLAVLSMAALLVPFLFAGRGGTLFVVAALIGPAYAGVTVVLDMLFAQVVDADLVRTGRSRSGLFSGIIGTVLRLSPALAGLLLGELLTMSGYDPGLPSQPPSAVTALRVLMTAMPGTALVLAGMALLAYPLHGERLANLEAEVRRLQPERAARSDPRQDRE